jgi:hypothetical protein
VPLPPAVTLNVAVCPNPTVTLAGCVIITGALMEIVVETKTDGSSTLVAVTV